MTLNKEEIKEANLIEKPQEDNFKAASYDLTVESIIDMNGKEHLFYQIPPQGMVYAIFNEIIKMDNKHIGFAHVKTSLTQKGIMATNIGIIDPGYYGPISTLLINFGSSTEMIEKGDLYLRLTFNKISDVVSIGKGEKITMENYLRDRRKDTDNLAEKFLNLSTVKDEVLRKVGKALIGLSIIFGAGSFAIGMYFQNKNSSDRDYQKEIHAIESSIKVLKEQIDISREKETLTPNKDSNQSLMKKSNSGTSTIRSTNNKTRR